MEARSAEPRNSDSPIGSADANADAGSAGDDLVVYGDEPINTDGSER